MTEGNPESVDYLETTHRLWVEWWFRILDLGGYIVWSGIISDCIIIEMFFLTRPKSMKMCGFIYIFSRFSSIDRASNLAAYFINKSRIRINKEHLLFPENQKFWKFIKNPLRKLKKCEIFPQLFDWKVYFGRNVLIYIVNTKGNQYKSMQIIIITEILENISHFFNFLNDFFMNFQNFWCSGKSRCPLLIRIQYLFTKYFSK